MNKKFDYEELNLGETSMRVRLAGGVHHYRSMTSGVRLTVRKYDILDLSNAPAGALDATRSNVEQIKRFCDARSMEECVRYLPYPDVVELLA